MECSGDNIIGEVEKWMLFVGTLHTTFTEHSMVRKSIKLWCLTIYRVNSEASQEEIAPNSNNCCDQRAESLVNMMGGVQEIFYSQLFSTKLNFQKHGFGIFNYKHIVGKYFCIFVIVFLNLAQVT